ncbi:hypothetical protein C0Q70_07544 [Pomacea canaliculata]|uniref:Uncharacterized protein n=1 Tax=Pomacea canaliculata TaxID=400727 RepID=A0A2T7PFB6_POMCA|nr:hypothetical protein C0Q70_07544 [Pomacea canaliculata]
MDGCAARPVSFLAPRRAFQSTSLGHTLALSHDLIIARERHLRLNNRFDRDEGGIAGGANAAHAAGCKLLQTAWWRWISGMLLLLLALLLQAAVKRCSDDELKGRQGLRC